MADKADQDEIARLKEERVRLLEQIDRLDYDIKDAERGILAGDEPGRHLTHLSERNQTQQGFMYELGKVEAQIDYLESRERERAGAQREERSLQAWEQVTNSDAGHHEWWRPAPGKEPPGSREEPGERSERTPTDEDWPPKR